MPKNKVLIVDDSKLVRKILRDLFEKNGFVVVGETNNGTEAVGLLNDLSPDIVMLDIIMPNMDGIETLKKLRSVDKDVKVIMVSALESLDKVKECLNAGANHYILKPFEEPKVLEIIKKIAG